MPNFVSFAAFIAELAHEEKSPGLFDDPGTEAFASEYDDRLYSKLTRSNGQNYVEKNY